MDQVRRTPALFDRRLGEWQPQPQYIPFNEFPPPPASPVIPYLYGRPVLRWDDWTEWARSQYIQLPEFIAPANPVIPPRIGQDVLAWPQAFLPGGYQRFPYFQQPAPASPVIPLRLGQDVLRGLEAFVPSAFQRFPYFQQAAPANPVIAYLQGLVVIEPVRPIAGQYLSFPFVGTAVVVPPTEFPVEPPGTGPLFGRRRTVVEQYVRLEREEPQRPKVEGSQPLEHKPPLVVAPTEIYRPGPWIIRATVAPELLGLPPIRLVPAGALFAAPLVGIEPIMAALREDDDVLVWLLIAASTLS